MPSPRQNKWTQWWGPLCLFVMNRSGVCDEASHAQVQAAVGLEAKNILMLHSHEANAPVFLWTDRGLL